MAKTLEWAGRALRLIDQTALPAREVYRDCGTWQEVAEAIRALRVRGAPAIGVAAAFGVVLAALNARGGTFDEIWPQVEEAMEALGASRPTGGNLFWALERMRGVAQAHRHLPVDGLRARLLEEAQAVLDEDIRGNRAIGRHGATLVPQGARVLTHCNAGALATAGYGTALGVIRAAYEAGRLRHVWVSETRPVLQGARLTAWELVKEGIPHRLIADSAAAALMARGQVDLVITGADRVAANGDTANKIGTYALAILAKEHGIPFYVAAPLSTIDLSLPTGAGIPIEERDGREVSQIGGVQIAPEETKPFNLAFDVTPARYIHAIITEQGIARPPYACSLSALFSAD